tara:strand:- start:752 stop:1162 length:411 start_codon:yes stop_codon:yes gene_type:complete
MENKNTVIVVAVIALLALVATSGNLTGFVPRANDVSSLSSTQEGGKLIVTVNPVGDAGNPGKIIDMREISGVVESANHASVETKCDDQGPRARGTSECAREIAVFNIGGTADWDANDRVQFTVRGTDIKSPVMVIR